MTDIWSYPKVFALGHPAIAELLQDPVTVEEKLDGSQFSFAVLDGELRFRSKGQIVFAEAPEKMFAPAVEAVKERLDQIPHELVFRGEFLGSPKHNTLKYDRAPEGGIAIFDVEHGPNAFLPPTERQALADKIGFESVPVYQVGSLNAADQVHKFLEMESMLGGAKVEGVVVKNHSRFGKDGKALMGKYVSEAFKEVHDKAWKAGNPQGKDVIQTLVDALRTDARREKAVQHLRERGVLEGSPRDIGALIKEVQSDVLTEEREQILEVLWKWASPKIARAVAGGTAEWYKERLMAEQFESASPE